VVAITSIAADCYCLDAKISVQLSQSTRLLVWWKISILYTGNYLSGLK